MSKHESREFGGVGALVVISVLVFVGLIISVSAWSWRNTAIDNETTITAQYKDNQNVYDNMWKSFREMAKVPAMYADKLKELYDSAIKSRYGGEGSRAMFQWLKEHNPNLDVSVYTQLQRAIEAGRTKFSASQTTLLDKKRVYERHLRHSFGPLWAGLWGYPTINLDQFDIVTSDRTDKAFDTKKDDEIELR